MPGPLLRSGVKVTQYVFDSTPIRVNRRAARTPGKPPRICDGPCRAVEWFGRHAATTIACMAISCLLRHLRTISSPLAKEAHRNVRLSRVGRKSGWSLLATSPDYPIRPRLYARHGERRQHGDPRRRDVAAERHYRKHRTLGCQYNTAWFLHHRVWRPCVAAI
ncbi:MAG: hypothetical protein QOE39_2189 [Bradyrhizobium sp.]|nr:hypothetical protein [Bradyrhizobium sp.]